MSDELTGRARGRTGLRLRLGRRRRQHRRTRHHRRFHCRAADGADLPQPAVLGVGSRHRCSRRAAAIRRTTVGRTLGRRRVGGGRRARGTVVRDQPARTDPVHSTPALHGWAGRRFRDAVDEGFGARPEEGEPHRRRRRWMRWAPKPGGRGRTRRGSGERWESWAGGCNGMPGGGGPVRRSPR